MDLNFYSDLSDGSGQNVDSEFLDTQPYSGYSENKFPGGSEHYLTINGAGHPFLSAEQTFHTPSLGDEVFEIPPISLDTVVSAFGELSDGADGTGGPSSSSSLVSNLVVGANDPSFASTYVNAGTQGLDHLNLGVMSQSSGGALLSSSALEMGSSMASHFRSSSPMTIDVADINNGLLGSSQLSTIDQSELGLGLAGGHILSRVKSEPLSATASPAGSLQDDDMDGTLYQSVLVDSPISLSSSSILPTMSSGPASLSSVTPAARRGGGKPATVSPAAGAKRPGRKKKDPNEPQKPVSAYALFFRDTQAAIKGQNPNASFGEVSKIVASMWDSLAEEQKQVYKRKTEAAKKDYLKALAAYRASQLSQPSGEVADTGLSPPLPQTPVNPPSTSLQVGRLSSSPYNPDENTITNICASNIILDVPEVTTRSRTGAKPATVPTTSPPAQTITKIIISNPGGGKVVTVLPGGVRTLQPRQPPPLQQMQNAPPPPRLQQMAPAPPRLLAKPSAASGLPATIAATPPPPLQIKIEPALLKIEPASLKIEPGSLKIDPGSLQCTEAAPIIVTSTATVKTEDAASSGPTQAMPAMALKVKVKTEVKTEVSEDDMEEELQSEEVQMELNESSDPGVCVRAGCNNPVIDSQDWDKEYCSNECVANHCRDIFMAWCSIRKQSFGKVK